jgi:hypothetical protein
VCRALRVLCAAVGRARLGELKRAAVSAHWELTGGAASLDELVAHLEEFEPDVLVLDAELGDGAVGRARAVRGALRVVSVGPADLGADQRADGLGDVRAAVLGLPKPGGPVRR